MKEKIAHYVNLDENGYVFVLSDSDCEHCVYHIQKWVHSKNLNKKDNLQGLYYSRTQKFLKYQSTIDSTANIIKWKTFDNLNVISEILETKISVEGPFLVKFQKGKIEYIKQFSYLSIDFQ